MSICFFNLYFRQCPLFASEMEKIVASPRELINLSMRGIGYKSHSVTALRVQISTHKRNVSFFLEQK